MRENIYVGIDVSAKTFDVCIYSEQKGTSVKKKFSNTAKGHESFMSRLRGADTEVRICLEATGIYSLDLAFALSSEFKIMVCNPRSSSAFHKALMKRAKTDKVDAEVLCQYCQKMDFVQWQPPEQNLIELRAITRRIQVLKKDLTCELNRQHAATSTITTPLYVLKDIEESVTVMRDRIKKLVTYATELITESTVLRTKYELLLTIPGIANLTALYLVSEIMYLPKHIDVRQLVAYAGLDPRPFESGTSVKLNTRISKKGNKFLRKTLYFPAIVAMRNNDNIHQYFLRLVKKGKTKKQAIIAIMRKLLHAIYGMFKHNSKFDIQKCFASRT